MVKSGSFRRFLLQSLALSLVSFIVVFAIKYFIYVQKSFVSLYFLIPFIAVVTVVFHAVLMKVSESNPRNFIGKFVAFSGLKLMIYLITILIYAFAIRNEVVIFFMGFLMLYLLFTILEIAAILKFLKKSSS